MATPFDAEYTGRYPIAAPLGKELGGSGWGYTGRTLEPTNRSAASYISGILDVRFTTANAPGLYMGANMKTPFDK